MSCAQAEEELPVHGLIGTLKELLDPANKSPEVYRSRWLDDTKAPWNGKAPWTYWTDTFASVSKVEERNPGFDLAWVGGVKVKFEYLLQLLALHKNKDSEGECCCTICDVPLACVRVVPTGWPTCRLPNSPSPSI